MNLTNEQFRACFPWRCVYDDNGNVITVRVHAWDSPQKARDRFSETTLSDYTVRWASNGRVPPADCLGDWHDLGLIDDHVLEASVAASEAETRAFLASYRRSRKGRKASAEELAEINAEFGPDANVVDAITGEKVR